MQTVKLFIEIIEPAGEGKFTGILTLTNKMGKQVSVEYTCTNPRKGPATVEQTSDERYLSLAGISTPQQLHTITNEDVYIATLIANLVLRSLELRDEIEQETNLRVVEGTGHAKFKVPHIMEDSMHDKIFGGKKKSPKKEPFYKGWLHALQTLLSPNPTPAMAS